MSAEKVNELNLESQVVDKNTQLKFCHQAGSEYERLLVECMGDPRSVANRFAFRKSGSRAERGYVPTFDSREAFDWNPKRRMDG
ncbi:MAG: hypothetical protein Q7S88_00095 [Candidatus Daviesbacteria bacterium]|nr:hypothetical protein [Candidatus Daviesbacteria bacterium]